MSLPSVMVTGCGCTWAGGVAAVGVCGHTGCDRECRCVRMVTVAMGCPCPKCPCVLKELPGGSHCGSCCYNGETEARGIVPLALAVHPGVRACGCV